MKTTMEEELEYRAPDSRSNVCQAVISVSWTSFHWLEYRRCGSLPGKEQSFLSSTPKQMVPGSTVSRLAGALCPQVINLVTL